MSIFMLTRPNVKKICGNNLCNVIDRIVNVMKSYTQTNQLNQIERYF
jgi:hypothetical protein